MLIQTDIPFSAVPSGVPADWTTPVKWDLEVSSFACGHPMWECAAEFPVGGSQYAALFKAGNRTCRPFKEEFHQFGGEVLVELTRRYGRSFSIYYVVETSEARPLSRAYLKAGTAAFHAVFCGRDMLVCADDLPLPAEGSSRSNRQVRFEMLHEEMKQNRHGEIESAIRKLFEAVCRPYWDMRGLYEVLGGLNGVLDEYRAKRGLPKLDPLDPLIAKPVYHMDDIVNRYVRLFCDTVSNSSALSGISGKLVKAMGYIQEHYQNDIGIEHVAAATGFSASYLHQLFKRELDRTFLDYLTEFRVEQAKRILRTENTKMAYVATRVGYRSPQHFSQVFKKMTGTLPHQYRDGGGRD
jgi:two-component system response regulator YesN